MKALFLDIDGVLNSSRSVLARCGVVNNKIADELDDCPVWGNPTDFRYTLRTIDPVAIGLVNRLLDKSGAKLFLSTSHRTMFKYNTYYGSVEHLARLNLYLEAMGISRPVYGLTPKLHQLRGDEVQECLDAHCQITDYVILDDGKDFYPEHPLVWCDPVVGFSAANYYECCKILGVQESSILI